MALKRRVAVFLFSLVMPMVLATAVPATPSRSAPTTPPAAPVPSSNTTQFIRTSCNVTLYPRVCFNTLVRYAPSLRSCDPVQLAVLATNVSLNRVRRVRAGIERAASPSPPSVLDPDAAAALGDCLDSLSTAEDMTDQSRWELAKLLVPGAPETMGPRVEWCIDNAKTWMSAALTDEDTCIDAFTSYTPTSHSGTLASLKGMVISRVRKAERLTSNALALINALVND